MNKTETITSAQYQAMIHGKKSVNPGKKQVGRAAPVTPKIISELHLYFTALGHICVKEYAFHPSRKWRFDLAFPEKKVAVEYEGIFSSKSRHTTVGGYSEDCNKYNEATALGWKVIRVTAKNASGITGLVEKAIHTSRC